MSLDCWRKGSLMTAHCSCTATPLPAATWHASQASEPRSREAPGARHRATFDAFATAQLLIAMASRYDTWDQLVAAAVPPGLPGAPEPERDPTLW